MLAFHNDPEIKAKYLERIERQIKKGRLRAGDGWDEKTKCGCAIGSTTFGYKHLDYANKLGVPVEIVYLKDAIFEGLAKNFNDDRYLYFPGEFIECIKVGADLSLVAPRFILWLLDGDDSPIPRKYRNHKLVKGAIDMVAALHREWIKTDIKPNRERFLDARVWAAGAAEAAEVAGVAAAAGVAGAAGAEEAARVARAAGAACASYASWTAGVVGVAGAEEADAHQTIKVKLIELLSEAGHTQTRDDCKK